MQVKHSVPTLVTTFLLILLFVVGPNLTNGKPLSAGDQNGLAFNPVQEQEEEEELEDEDEEDEEGEEDEDHEDDDDFEDEMHHLEMEQIELESNLGQIEVIKRVAEIAKDDVATAGYALMMLEELMEDEEEGIGMLKEMIASSDVSKPVKNLLRMKLVEVYSSSDQSDEAIKVLKSLIKN